MDDRQGIARRNVLLSSSFVIAASALLGETLITAASTPVNAQARDAVPAPLPADAIGDVAIRAYTYAYPLILMEMTRRVTTNVADASHVGKVPMNQLETCGHFQTPRSRMWSARMRIRSIR